MRLLLVSHGRGRSGYARVGQAILGAVTDEIDRHHFAIDVRDAGAPSPWPVYANTLEGDPHGHRQLADVVTDVEPDVVLVHHEPWVYRFYHEALSNRGRRPRMAYYCPIEGVVSRPDIFAAALEADELVTQSEFGAQELRTIDGRAGRHAVPTPIPCGVSSDVFYPLASAQAMEATDPGELTADALIRSRPLARAMVWPDRHDLADAFVVLNANLCSPRKDLQATVEGFARFASGRSAAVKLCLLQPGVRPGMPGSSLLARLTQEGRVLEVPFPRPLTDGQLNLLYNACDVGVNTASAEGWGLFSHEHAATGAVQIVPAYAGPGELWSEVGFCVEADVPRTRPGDWFEHRSVSPAAVAGAFGAAYSAWCVDRLGSLSLRTYQHATQSRLQWSTIGAQWSELLLRSSARR